MGHGHGDRGMEREKGGGLWEIGPWEGKGQMGKGIWKGKRVLEYGQGEELDLDARP